MAPITAERPPTPKREVKVFVEKDHPEVQPATFNLCPLGVQFYSPKPMEEFQLLELDVDTTDAQGKATKVTCQGAVVRCQCEPQPNRYRIWVKFIEVPEGAQERLRCTAKEGGHLCSHCENF